MASAARSPLNDDSGSPAGHVPEAPAWEEAFLRVESYLRAHHLESRVRLNQLASEIIRDARERALAQPDVEPVELALRVTHERIGAWFALAGKTGDWADERVRAHGRLALVLENLSGRWPNRFLSKEPVPADMAEALVKGELHPGPALRFSNMAPAPLEFGFEESDDPKLERVKDGWQRLRDAGAWLLIAGLFGAAWAASH